MSATNCEEYSSTSGVRSNLSAQSVRVLCCFTDQSMAREYEHALIERGFLLLRARHEMHAYWLALAAKPDLLVIDGREIDIANDYLLGRLRQNSKLGKTPILVITNQGIAIDPDVQARLSLLSGDIEPSALAARVSNIILEMKHIQQQNVDAFFSDADGDTQDFSPSSARAIRRTDTPQQQVASQLRQETQRWRPNSIGR